MGNLEKTLPKIVGDALRGENQVVQTLAFALLREIRSNPENADIYPRVRKILDDEIEKSMNANPGLFSAENFEWLGL